MGHRSMVCSSWGGTPRGRASLPCTAPFLGACVPAVCNDELARTGPAVTSEGSCATVAAGACDVWRRS